MSFWKRFFGTPNNLPDDSNSELEDLINTFDTTEEKPDINASEINDDTEEKAADDKFLEESKNTSDAISVGIEPQNHSSNQKHEVEAQAISMTEVPGPTPQDSPGGFLNTESDSDSENSKSSSNFSSENLQNDVSDEDRLKKELDEAASAALEAQLDAERQEVFEDLSVLDGRILPNLAVPDWRQELEFVKERYEPCDLSDHIVKVSKRRLTARQIDHELAQSRLNAYERYLERATRRFKEKIDEDALLNRALLDLNQWRSEQAKSVGWVLADRVNEEVLKAKSAEQEATSFVENNPEFTNPLAIEQYRHFARRMFLIPVTTLYIMSVVALTYSRFEWIMKFFPLFNLGLAKFQMMVLGIGSYFLLVNFWRYSKKVSKIQKQFENFNAKYVEQEKKIRHAVSEHTRLSQQQPLLEPILEVLARAYRVQLQADEMAKVKATTEFDTKTLPACVTLARADDSEESKMARLRQRALGVLMTPGWRTRGLNDIAKVHAESKMLDASTLTLSSLDTDSMVSASNARRMLLEAFNNSSIHERVSRKRLVRAIEEIHNEVLANFNSYDRPRVVSLRDDGFDKIAFRTSWLAENDGSEEWIPFLSEILSEETSPFGLFNMNSNMRRSELTNSEEIRSIAVVPQYFAISAEKLQIVKPMTSEIAPLDVAVRVDVSPWADPAAFAVFAISTTEEISQQNEHSNDSNTPMGGMTGA